MEVTILGARYFSYLGLLFDSNCISGFRIVKGIFLTKKLPENNDLSGPKIEKTANLSQTWLAFHCQKWLFLTFAILTVDVLNTSDDKLDEILKTF